MVVIISALIIGSDYEFPSGFELNFAPDDSRLSVALSTLPDEIIEEARETYSLLLSVPSGQDFSTGSNSSASIFILDDDCKVIATHV